MATKALELIKFDTKTKEFLERYKKQSVVFQILLKAEDLDMDIYFIRLRPITRRVYYVNKRTARNIGKKRMPYGKMTESKLGKLVNRINKKLEKPRNIGPKAIEKAANIMSTFDVQYTHEITTDIKKVYHHQNSVHSCMTKKSTARDMEFYEKNKVKAFIVKNKKGQIVFRTLVWESVEVHKIPENGGRYKNLVPLRMDVYDHIYAGWVKCDWKIIGMELLQKAYPKLVSAEALIDSGNRLVYNLPVQMIYAKYPYFDNFKYISYDYTSISTHKDHKFLNRELPTDVEATGANNMGPAQERLLASCPECEDVVFEGILLIDQKKDKVQGCAKCTILNKFGKYIQIEEMEYSQKIRHLKYVKFPKLKTHSRIREIEAKNK